MPLFPLNPERLYFRVDEWSDDGLRVVDTLAAACNFHIAMRAFEAATRKDIYGRRRLTLREGTKLIREHIPEDLVLAEKIEDVLDRYGIPHGYSDVKVVRDLQGIRIAVSASNSPVVYCDMGSITKLAAEIRRTGTPEYAAQFERALDEAKSV
jgi:hypothetical protein